MDIATIIRTLIPMADAFELYSIPNFLTGSLAVSVFVSKTQTAQGIEVVADIKFSRVLALVSFLEKTFDVKERAIRDAIEQRGSFPLVHHDTLEQIDVILPAYRAYSQVRQERAQRHALKLGVLPWDMVDKSISHQPSLNLFQAVFRQRSVRTGHLILE